MLVKEEAPSITEFHSSTKVLPLGHTAQFSCDAGGTPEPTVEWLHNGRPLERDSTDNQSEPVAWVERGFLFVRGVKSGVNTVCCMATNSAGSANHTAELLVFQRNGASANAGPSWGRTVAPGPPGAMCWSRVTTVYVYLCIRIVAALPLLRSRDLFFFAPSFADCCGVLVSLFSFTQPSPCRCRGISFLKPRRAPHACELTLDPNTAYRHLSLSEDNRKVTLVREDQSYPDHPERFDYWYQVLCREGLTGHCYWEVEREGGVSIGVTYRGITRRRGGDDSLLGGKSWSLYCDDYGYTAWYNGSRTDIDLPPTGSNRVGVYLDRPAGTLSFYRVSPDVGGSSYTLTHIHTFQSTFTQEDLHPGFGLRRYGTSVSLCGL
ncbi:unnamed protein product [Lota lota]